MMEVRTKTPPLGIIDSLSTGFGAVAQQPHLLLIPLLLDLFLWLGPRLSITPIASKLAAQLVVTTRETAGNSAVIFEQNTAEILGSYNLFSALSTWPLGTPSLLAGNDAGTGPLSPPPSIEVQTLEGLVVWLLVLVLMGLLIGSLYLSLIARRVGGNKTSLRTWVRHIGVDWVRIIGFVALVLVAAFLISVPFFFAMEIVALILAPVASLMFLVGIGIGMWALFHLFFTAHGILLNRFGVRPAIIHSVRLVRRYRLSSAGLLFLAVVISLGLSKIWNIPESESWVRLVAIAGNAFVNTGLVMATFVFYDERTAD